MHDPEVNHLVVVALQHHAHDVFADVVHIALHRGHKNAALHAGGALPLHLFEVRLQVGHRLLHDTRALDHLGQEHFPRAEQIAHHAHAGHERTFDDLQRGLDLATHLLGVFFDKIRDALDEGVFQPFFHGQVAPFQLGRVVHLAALGGVNAGRVVQHALRGIGPAVQDQILGQLAQLRLQPVVHGQLAGIDNAHIHTRLHRVVQENGVHGLADHLLAAEGEGQVADAAADARVRAAGLDLADRLDEVHPIVGVLGQAGAHREHVGVENDVFGREVKFIHQQPVGAGTDVHPPLQRVGLALFVEGHHDHGRPVAAHRAGVVEEGGLPFLQANGVHHALALHTLQAGLDDVELGGVNHHGHPADGGF